jgi:2-dehydro-3-deoxygluconokinase
MIELCHKSENSMQRSFAGDSFNSAVYLKRTFPDSEVSYFTAVGTEYYSKQMINLFEAEELNLDFVYQCNTKTPGLYTIRTDACGERSFAYWRNDSAARQAMKFIDQIEVEKLSKQDMFFFSGVSLAVIDANDRTKFWDLIASLKNAGVTIVFDPNYRARLWDSKQDAKKEFEFALSQTDICLPGVDDFEQLYGHRNSLDVAEFCKQFSIGELIIKNGEKGILCVLDGEAHQFDVEPISNVVDTTSAGDSFNGAYLGARLNGYDLGYAVEVASKAASFVIQFQGAIVPQKKYQIFIDSLQMKPSSQAASI